MATQSQCGVAPFEPTTSGCQQQGRRVPNGPRPALMRPRPSAVRSRAAHVRRGPCDALLAGAVRAEVSGHRAEEECASGFVNDLIQDAVDEDVSGCFQEVVDFEDSEEEEECAEDYDEVLSLCGDDEESEEDQELDAFQFVNLACNFAHKVVHQGIELDIQRSVKAADDEEEEEADFSVVESFDGQEEDAEYESAGFSQCFGQQLQQQASEADEFKALRLEARQTLLRAATDGSLAAAFRQVCGPKKAKLQSLKAEARAALQKAGANGELAVALRNSCTQRAEAPAMEDDIKTLRQEARQTLLAAARDGRLAAAFGEMRCEREEEEEAAEMARLRSEARETLLSASRDGRLLAALREAHSQADEEAVDLESLRLEARACLVHAAQDGQLAAAFVNARKETELESLRLEARDIILRAASDGQLQAALEEVSSRRQEVEDLRLEAQKSLLPAASDGRLAAAFSELRREREEEVDVEALRAEARETLLSAARDGHLSQVLKEVAVSREAPAPAYEEEEEEEAEEVKMAAIVRKDREALYDACENSGMDEAFKEIRAMREAKALAATPFHLRPSVGTWLMPPSFVAPQAPSASSQPVSEPVAEVVAPAIQFQVPAAVQLSAPAQSTWKMQPSEVVVAPTVEQPSPVPERSNLLLDTDMPLSEKLEQLAERPVSPSAALRTPGRTKRRIIGGVSRQPSTTEFMEATPLSAAPALSPKSERSMWTMAGSPAAGLRRNPSTYRLDGEDSGCEGAGSKGGFSRKTSLTAMFETMGSAELYRMDVGDAEEASGDKRSSRKSPFSKLNPQSSPSSRSMAKSASAGAISAMAMDLGRPSSSSAMATDLGLSPKAQAPARLPTPSMGNRCSSVGSLRALKTTKSGKQAGLLPMLSKPGGSAADWSVSQKITVNLSKRTHEWSTMGASPVF